MSSPAVDSDLVFTKWYWSIKVAAGRWVCFSPQQILPLCVPKQTVLPNIAALLWPRLHQNCTTENKEKGITSQLTVFSCQVWINREGLKSSIFFQYESIFSHQIANGKLYYQSFLKGSAAFLGRALNIVNRFKFSKCIDELTDNLIYIIHLIGYHCGLQNVIRYLKRGSTTSACFVVKPYVWQLICSVTIPSLYLVLKKCTLQFCRVGPKSFHWKHLY